MKPMEFSNNDDIDDDADDDDPSIGHTITPHIICVLY